MPMGRRARLAGLELKLDLALAEPPLLRIRCAGQAEVLLVRVRCACWAEAELFKSGELGDGYNATPGSNAIIVLRRPNLSPRLLWDMSS